MFGATEGFSEGATEDLTLYDEIIFRTIYVILATLTNIVRFK